MKFCQLCIWWNPHVISEMVSPYPIYYHPKLMEERGWEVEILTKPYSLQDELKGIVERKKLESGYPEKEVEEIEGLTVRRFKGGRAISSIRMLRYFSRNLYSLVHLHSLGVPEDLSFASLCRIRKIPLVFSHHAASLPDVLQSSGIVPSFMKESLKFMNRLEAVFVAFTEVQALLYKRMGIKRAVVIPHGLDPKILLKKDERLVKKFLAEFNLLHVGFFEPRKGQEIVIRCMPEILEEYPSTNLILVGKNLGTPYQIYLQLLSREQGVEEHVHFLRASRRELIQLYLHSDIFAFPTTGEIFGHVYTEAMAAGCPIITTDKPVAREILQGGKDGMLVERSVDAFRSGILELMSDKALRKKLARNAKKNR